MQLETVLGMIVGLVALAVVRILLAFAGRDFAEDHRPSAASLGHPSQTALRAHRGTGRNRHLLYVDVPVVAPLTAEPLEATELPSRKAS